MIAPQSMPPCMGHVLEWIIKAASYGVTGRSTTACGHVNPLLVTVLTLFDISDCNGPALFSYYQAKTFLHIHTLDFGSVCSALVVATTFHEGRLGVYFP